jgi:hypothetical protein
VRRGGEVEGFGGCGRGWGRNGKKWRTKKRLDRDAWRGVKVEKGADRLARFDSMGETTALLPLCDETLALNSIVTIKHQYVHSWILSYL